MSDFKNKVFIATSMDGYIADKNGGIDWLNSVPPPEGSDMGFVAFMDSIDALVMGRTTFETVLSFGVEWPYTKHVFVLSTTLKEIPSDLEGKVSTVNGTLEEVLNRVHGLGYHKLYIDGGRTIQSFMAEDRIDEMIIATIPKVLGGGVSLFGGTNTILDFECTESEVFSNGVVQSTFVRNR